jgi:hypothetical protein
MSAPASPRRTTHHLKKMLRLVAALREQQAEAARLDPALRKNLKTLGYGLQRRPFHAPCC